MAQRVPRRVAPPRAELLFLDEPTGGVDPKDGGSSGSHLRAGRGRGDDGPRHDAPTWTKAEQCDRLAFILDGELIAEGTPPDLKEGWPAPSSSGRRRRALRRPRRRPRRRLARGRYLFGTRLRAVARPGAGASVLRLLGRTVRTRDGRSVLEDASLAGAATGGGRQGRPREAPSHSRLEEFAHLRRDPITVRLISFIPVFQTSSSDTPSNFESTPADGRRGESRS